MTIQHNLHVYWLWNERKLKLDLRWAWTKACPSPPKEELYVGHGFLIYKVAANMAGDIASTISFYIDTIEGESL